MSKVERFHGFGGGGGGGGGLTSDAKSLGADVNAVGALQTILTSADLATGVWLVTWSVEMTGNTASLSQAIRMDVGTAVATFKGSQSASYESLGEGAGEPIHLTVTALVTITTHGTLIFRAMFSGGTGAIRFQSNIGGYPNATGYTAVKIA